jgi:hypothetical protein
MPLVAALPNQAARVFDCSTELGAYENVDFPTQLGQRFRDVDPTIMASEEAYLESQVGQEGIGDRVHDPCCRSGLAVFPDCYKPDSDELRHKYIVMEFRYEKQLELSRLGHFGMRL